MIGVKNSGENVNNSYDRLNFNFNTHLFKILYYPPANECFKSTQVFATFKT